MLKLSSKLKQKIKTKALQTPDKEVAGLVNSKDQIVWVQNTAEDPTEDFRIEPKSFSDAEDRLGEVTAVIHTHCKESQAGYLSFSDIQSSKAFSLPFILYHSIFDTWDLYDPSHIHPFPLIQKSQDPKDYNTYLGWSWIWNRADCYELLRHYYKGVLDIEVADVKRSPDFTEYLQDDWDRYRKEFNSVGFQQIHSYEDLRTHDVILMQLDGKSPHHVGIIVDIEKYIFIHHLMFPRLSESKVYGGYWKQNTNSVWRHTKLL